MILEKLTITDTFKQWRDKINVIINEYEGVPSTDPNGVLTIDTDSIQAKSFVVDIPSNFNKSVIFYDNVTITNNTAVDKIGEIYAISSSTRKLYEKVYINATQFDGSKDITTAKWGEMRPIYISDYAGDNIGKVTKVNGSEKSYTFSMPEKFQGYLDGISKYAENLKNKHCIDGVSFDGSSDITHYGVCHSDSSEQIKTVTIPNFVLKTGATVTVKFENTNTIDDPKLNVNETGDKLIYLRNKPIEKSTITASSTYTFIYDGEYFNIITSADNSVVQSETSLNVEYPLLASPITNGISGVNSSLFTSKIVMNPSKNSISANKFIATIDNDTPGAFFVTKNLLEDNKTPVVSTSIRYVSYEDNDNHMLSGIEFQKNSDGSRYSNIIVPMFNANGEENSWSKLQVGWTGGETPQPQVNCDGNLFVGGELTATKIYGGVSNDYAEFFERGEETEAGDIVALDITSNEERYVKATEKSKLVVGIHSDTYGHILGGDVSIEESEKTHIPVGLSGRVYVKFKGKSILGEGVVPSNTPGVGRLYDEFLDDKRKIVGYIVYDPEPSSANERRVRVLINR